MSVTDDEIPWLALMPVMLGRMSEAIVASCPYPFLPSMMRSFSLGPKEVSVYTGVAESLLLLTEGLVAMPFSRLCDSWGRRPMLLLSTAWLGVACACLGTSGSVAAVLVWRWLGGLNAMRQVCKTMVGEMSNDKTRVKIFSVYVPVTCTGALLGSFIGGLFSEPAGRLGWLGGIDVLQARPYLLPCVIGSLVPFGTLLFALRYSIETKPAVLQTVVSNRSGRALAQPGMLLLLLAYMISQALDFGCNAATSLVANVEVEHGGLDMGLTATAWISGIQGTIYMFVAPAIVQYLTRRYSKVDSLLILMSLWPFLVPVYVLAGYLARLHREWLNCGVVLLMTMRVVAGACWALYDMITIELSSPELLSASISYFIFLGNLGAAFGPFAFGSMFGLSTQYSTGTLGRQSVWLALLVFSLLPIPLILRLKAALEVPIEKEGENQPLLAGIAPRDA